MFPQCNLHDRHFFDVTKNTPSNASSARKEREEYSQFLDLLEGSKKSKSAKKDQNWKKFVKQAMYFYKRAVLHDKQGFRGYLHDCESTTETMFNLLAIPKIDKDRWIQYCITNFGNIGNERIFVEFDVDWNEWANEEAADWMMDSDHPNHSITLSKT